MHVIRSSESVTGSAGFADVGVVNAAKGAAIEEFAPGAVAAVIILAMRPAVDVRAAAAVRHGRPLALIDALPVQADAVRCTLVAACPAIVVVIGELVGMDAHPVDIAGGGGADALPVLADVILRTRVAAFPTMAGA